MIDDGIPDFLKVQNRQPLSAEQQARVDAFLASRRPAARRQRSTIATGLARNIDDAGKAILREQQRAAKQAERDKAKAKIENRERARRVLAMARAAKGQVQ